MTALQSCAGSTDAVLAAIPVRTVLAQGALRALTARLYETDGESDGLIVFFPPGGFMRDTLDELDLFARALVQRTGCRVLASTYTLASEAPFPAAAEDAHAVLQWAVSARKLLGWRGTHLLVAGIEAGGNLAAVASMMARDRSGPAIAGQILVTPMLDPDLATCSMRDMSPGSAVPAIADACAAGYRGYLQNAADRIHPYASPLRSRRLKGLPPTLILAAEDDALRDEGQRYGAQLAEHDVATTVVRLPSLHLRDPNARCDAVRVESVLGATTEFIAGIMALI